MAFQERNEEKAQYLRAIFDAIPVPTFIVDSDVRIEDLNTAAEQFLGPESAATLHRHGGEAFHCIHAEAKGCGRGASCRDCVIRHAISKAVIGQGSCRELHRAELRTERGVVAVDLLVTASLLPYTEKPKAVLILEDVTFLTHRRRGGNKSHRGGSKH